MTPAGRQQDRARRAYQRSGLFALRSALEAFAERDTWLEELGDVGAALKTWKEELLSDLGGEAGVSQQQRAIVEIAAKTLLLLESVDRFLLSQPSLVNRRRRALFPVVEQRQRLADSLLRHLTALGLERRPPEPEDLESYLATRTQR